MTTPFPTRKIVLITGASGQLGRAVAQAFLDQGARLILLDRHRGELPDGKDLRHVTADLADRAQVVQRIGEATAQMGGLHTVCHIAGGFRMGEAVHETSAATWDLLMDLNARSLLHVAAATVPLLLEQGGGQIVTVGAGAAARGGAQMGAYSASKSALIRLTESMSAELKDQGIRVNCVLPSIIDTPDNRQSMPDADFARWVAPQALAEVIAFLASDAARAIHGAAIPVSGRV
ncbi:SDR family oxidoreductase [Pseudacidovorax intermedius]|uniref:NAD(P)-dependent dehydrogenase (Short-subunit alcohol dehydrogenase family) n=1 Tax=Pseudacidovorax intermedius TaxID=433924 RepID=A0A370FCG9_9BURK|nr:SDR family NAD(P)-dependent oxidoreductase [Pseudacidovorax intermedius]RDI22639.1 NAD(P)-dependent dehydrogenase (short-subunit alcohol dehydrogenase family) [Pseudacidovorax intermedius]